MTKPAPPRPPDALDRTQALRILAQMGENGKPPELGISHINVGNESYLHVIDKTYVQDLVRSTEGSSFKLVQGTYGAGKTHFLYCVRDLAWRRDLLAAFITISPKECPFNKPIAVYRAVAQRIALARGNDDDDTRGIEDVIHRRIEERLEADGKEATLTWIDKTLGRAPLARHSYRDAAAGFARALVEGDRAAARRLGAWLRGEDISLSEVKPDGVYEVPSNENGFGMFRSLVQLVHRLGYEGTAVLLDEAERRMSVEAKPTKALTETIDHLRELIDLCGRAELPRTLILYAVTPSFTEHVLPLYPALQQRLGQPVQYLTAANPKAPVIDLEALDLGPYKLLVEIGKRLARVAKRAYEWTPDEKIVEANLELLATTVADVQLEVGHRRFFVKCWVRLLDKLRLEEARVLTEGEIRAFVGEESSQILEITEDAIAHDSTVAPAAPPAEDGEGSIIGNFLGHPIRREKPKKKS